MSSNQGNEEQRKRPKPSLQVIEKVAAAKGVSTDELAPLYESVEPEILDCLFESDKFRQADGQIQFRYEGFTVRMDSDGIEIEEQ